jgi:hypothetical protein
MPIDYTKSKIYKIVCNETGETYYGSTVQTLSQRLAKHRHKTNNVSSKQIIQRGNYDIILCEECPCENKEQLHAIERKWIEGNECVNKFIPGRTKKQWYVDNRVEKLLKQKQYNEAHKEEIIQYKKQYYQANKEEILLKQQQYKKQYYQENKEQILLKKQQYYEANKTKLQ